MLCGPVRTEWPRTSWREHLSEADAGTSSDRQHESVTPGRGPAVSFVLGQAGEPQAW